MSDQNIIGGRELDALLQSLAPKMEQNIMRGALAAGARVIRDEAKANVAERLGQLKKSVRVSTRAKNGVVTATIKAGSKEAWYWRFVEFGTAQHLIKPKTAAALLIGGAARRSVMHPGARPKPFMRPAFDNKSSEAIEAIRAHIKKRLTAQGLNTADPTPGGPA